MIRCVPYQALLSDILYVSAAIRAEALLVQYLPLDRPSLRAVHNTTTANLSVRDLLRYLWLFHIDG